MLAPDGRCKTFDAAADGFVRAEGCGVIVLKRLSDAVADGDNILALIRGSAVNQDGRSSGLTVPKGPSQQAVIRQALENGGVEPARVSYIEAHGTGTSLGDPIEVGALGAVFGKNRPQDQPLMIGSVKTNIGHMEAAAGIAGLIKAVLQLQHQEIPPHLHFKQPHPHITWDQLPLLVPTERSPWECAETSRIVGVSSFGFSGTNAHVVLEEAPGKTPVASEVECPLHLLTLSAKSESALRELAQKYQQFLANHPEASLADICFTANVGGSHFNNRLAVVAESSVQLQGALSAFAAGKETLGLVSAQLNSRKRPRVAFLFTGEGSQYVGMGRQLYDTQPTFRASLDKANEILRPYLEKPLLEVLYPSLEGEQGEIVQTDSLVVNLSSPNLLDQPVYAQTALFALEYALVELWKSWGIEPSVVMGDGVGEYVAACVAGVFSVEDGLKLVASRGHLTQALPQNSEMVADFERVAFVVTYSSPRIGLISNVTGKLTTSEVANPEYWGRNVQQQVRFAQGMQTLEQQGYSVFVEVGPLPTWDWSQVVGKKSDLGDTEAKSPLSPLSPLSPCPLV